MALSSLTVAWCLGTIYRPGQDGLFSRRTTISVPIPQGTANPEHDDVIVTSVRLSPCLSQNEMHTLAERLIGLGERCETIQEVVKGWLQDVVDDTYADGWKQDATNNAHEASVLQKASFVLLEQVLTSHSSTNLIGKVNELENDIDVVAEDFKELCDHSIKFLKTSSASDGDAEMYEVDDDVDDDVFDDDHDQNSSAKRARVC